MKKRLTTVVTILALFLGLGLHAEDMVLDSLHTFGWDGSAWELEEKTLLTYDEDVLSQIKYVSEDEIILETYDVDGNLTSETELELDDTVWVFTSRYIYVYEDNMPIEDIEQEFDSVWVNIDKRIRTYDANGNTTSWYDEVWDELSEAWIIEEGETKTTEEFDANGQQIDELGQTYISGAWVDTKVYTFTMDENDLVTKIQWKDWDDSTWVNGSYNINYSYNELGQKVEEEWFVPEEDAELGDYSVKYSKWYYTYDDEGQVTREIRYRNTLDNGEYKTYSDYSYTYDSVGNVVMKVYDRYNSDYTGFAPYRKYTYAYDADGNQVKYTYLRANADNDGYYLYSTDTTAYVNLGFELLSKSATFEIYERSMDFEEGEWIDNRESDYTIDTVTGYVTEIQARDWNDSVWVNTSSNAIYEYDTLGNVITEIWNKSTDTSALGEYEELYYKWDRTYNSQNLLLTENRVKGNATNDGYDPYRYYEYNYDVDGNEIYELQKRVSDDAYYDYREYIRSYDANSNLIEEIYNTANSDKSSLKTYRKYTYEYNAEGQEISYLYAVANTEDSLTYDNYERTLTTYSAEGYVISVRDEEWENDAWVLDEETMYDLTLNGDGMITKSIELVTEDDVVTDSIEMIETFYTGLLIDSVYTYEYDDEWLLEEKTYYIYDEGMLVTMIEDELDERTITNYDANGYKTVSIEEEMIAGVYMPIEKRLYEYDADGNQLMYVDKEYDDFYGWNYVDGAVKREYSFDENGSTVAQTWTKWSQGYGELDEELIAEIEESPIDDIFKTSYIFSLTEDDETYEYDGRLDFFFSAGQTSALEDEKVSEFGHLYPNPTNAMIYLPEGDYNFSIYSLEGKMMLSGSRAEVSSVAVNDMAKGVYLINYKGAGTVATERFIVR